MTRTRRRHAGRLAALTRTAAFAALFALLAGTAVAPAAVEAASLEDQLAVSKGRQQALSKSIDRQDGVLQRLRVDQAETSAALRDTSAQLAGINADQEKVRRLARRRPPSTAPRNATPSSS